MRNTITNGVLAAALMGLAQPALADSAETKGGIKVKTDDGRFEANVGGRIHWDINVFDADEDAFGATTGGSELQPNASSAYLRRVYLTLKGKLYGWNYKIEPDLANNNGSGATGIAFQDVTLSTELFGGEIILGQFKPFRGMEELTSSNDLLMIERPFASANGIFSGREFQQGVGYKYSVVDGLLIAGSGFLMRGSTTAANAGTGYALRTTYAPLMDEGRVLHFGVSYSHENPQNNGDAAIGTAANFGPVVAYGGRRGPSLTMDTSAGSQSIDTLGAEAATALGPFYLQAEYMSSRLDKLPTATPSDTTVDAYYVQVAFDVTGESRPYKKGDAVFGNVKPNGAAGAFELTARYDFAENQDTVGGCTVKANYTGAAAVAPAGADKCEATAVTAGLNWYANPNVRFMLNYVMGTYDAGAGGKDEPTAYVLRTQVSF